MLYVKVKKTSSPKVFREGAMHTLTTHKNLLGYWNSFASKYIFHIHPAPFSIWMWLDLATRFIRSVYVTSTVGTWPHNRLFLCVTIAETWLFSSCFAQEDWAAPCAVEGFLGRLRCSHGAIVVQARFLPVVLRVREYWPQGPLAKWTFTVLTSVRDAQGRDRDILSVRCIGDFDREAATSSASSAKRIRIRVRGGSGEW